MNPTLPKLLFSLSCLCYATCATAQNDLLLKNYRPVSIYHTPRTEVAKAAYPVIDMHSHDYAATPEEIAQWVVTMDAVGGAGPDEEVGTRKFDGAVTPVVEAHLGGPAANRLRSPVKCKRIGRTDKG